MWSIILPCGVALITACLIYLQSWHHIKIKLVLERIKYIREIFNYVGKNHTLFRLSNNTRNIKNLWEQGGCKVKIHNKHALFIMSLGFRGLLYRTSKQFRLKYKWKYLN